MVEDMFIKGMRKDAQQSVVLITDWKPLCAFKANETVEQHVKNSGYCGWKLKINILSKTATNAEACAAPAVGASKSTFMRPLFFHRWCYD